MSHHEKVLESFHSAFQPILLTEDETGLRTLRFAEDGAAQSAVRADNPRHLSLPYARVLPACLAFIRQPRRVLVVGLGGGSLPRFFHSHYAEMQIDVVELDRMVLEVAKRHCGLVEDERLRVHIEDGRDFIERSPGGYDLLLLDCFDAETIPAHLTTVEFLCRARDALAVGGAVVANIWGPAVNPRYADMLQTYRAAFAEVFILDVPGPGTKVFVAFAQERAMSREELFAKLAKITLERGFDYNLAEAVTGFRSAQLETARAGSVLRD